MTRKRIEVAILAVLAVVLGFYVYDRIGMRMGGVPSPIQSALATEEDWMLDTILRDISTTASYARGGTIEDVELEVERVPTGALTLPSVAATIRLGDGTAVSNRAIPLEGSFWNPANYAGLAAELLGAAGSNGRGSAASDAPEALLDPRPSVLASESDRISALLAADPRDASAHEEAALLLAVFGLREAAYGFDDTRFQLLRITAHLSIARGLRAGASTVTGEIAEAALLALAGRQAQLLEALERLPADSNAAQSWRSALYMYSTDDWRTAAPSESLLVRLMRFRALASALGASNAIDRAKEAASSELADWGRILAWLSSRDVSARGFIETQLGRELREIQEVAGRHRKPIATPGELAEALNELPGALVGPEGPRVLSWGLWAAFFQRHLAAALVARDEHIRGALGLPNEAVAFGREAERVFSGLMLNPIVQVHRTRYVGARVESTIGMDDAISLTRRRPELVNPTQWGYLEETALHMMRRRGMPSARSWLSANVLATGLIGSSSSRFEILKATIDLEALRDLIAEVGPTYVSAIRQAQGRLGEEKMTFEELSALLGERLEFDRQALRTLLGVARSETDRVGVMERLCELDANECYRLGWELVDAGRDAEAADAFQRMVERAPNRVGVCNDASWLVGYYLEQGRVDDAIDVADIVAEVYCSRGLLTKAYLLERLGRFIEAEELYQANQERYDSELPVSPPLLGFYYRMARGSGDREYEARLRALLDKIFPAGLERLSPQMDPSAATDGVLIDGNSRTLEQAGIRGGDVIVGLDGWRVRSLEQYDAIRHLRPTMGGTRDAKLRVWSQSQYLDVDLNSRYRTLDVRVRTYGSPAPSTKER